MEIEGEQRGPAGPAKKFNVFNEFLYTNTAVVEQETTYVYSMREIIRSNRSYQIGDPEIA